MWGSKSPFCHGHDIDPDCKYVEVSGRLATYINIAVLPLPFETLPVASCWTSATRFSLSLSLSSTLNCQGQVCVGSGLGQIQHDERCACWIRFGYKNIWIQFYVKRFYVRCVAKILMFKLNGCQLKLACPPFLEHLYPISANITRIRDLNLLYK